jgi:hypothetical protein
MKKGYTILVLAALSAIACSSLFMPVSRYSAMENRYLTTWPGLSVENILSGTFQKDLEKALSDQFPFRDACVKLSVEGELAMGRQDISEVYAKRDGSYVEKVVSSELSKSRFDLNLRFLSKMAEDHQVPVDLFMVPGAPEMEPYRLPAGAPYYDAASYRAAARHSLSSGKAEAGEVSVVPVDFRMRRKEHYFYTDHHYNNHGAYECAMAYRSYLGKKRRSYHSYGPKLMADDFRGTLYSKAPRANAKYDRIILPSLLQKVSVSYEGGSDGHLTNSGEKDSLYDLRYLKEKDKYSTYQGGNHGLVRVKVKDGTGKGKLLIIKDSFANSVLPYLVGDYREVDMIDLRYYTGSVKEYLEKEQPDRVLVYYEMSNFIKEEKASALIR